MARKKQKDVMPLYLRRDIRFRAVAKPAWPSDDLDNSDGFIYGVPDTRELDIPHHDKIDATVILVDPSFVTLDMDGYPRSVGVDADSIGEFSGLKDADGRDIYEGDIVQWTKDNRKYVVKFRSGMFYASVEELNKGIHGGFPLWVLCEEEQPCHIVGNIHEQLIKRMQKEESRFKQREL